MPPSKRCDVLNRLIEQNLAIAKLKTPIFALNTNEHHFYLFQGMSAKSQI